MSTSATLTLVRHISRLTIEMRRPGADLRAMLATMRALGGDVAAFNLPDIFCVWHCRQAELLLSLGRPQQALTEARAGAASLGDHRQEDLLADALVWQARALNEMGDWVALDRVVAGGIDLVESHRTKVSGAYLEAGYLRNRIFLYALGVRAAVKLGDVDNVIVRSELSKCRLARLTQIQEATDLRAKLVEISARITDLESGGHDVSRLMVRRRALWDAYLRSTKREMLPKPTCLAALQATLSPEEAVISYYWIDRDSLMRLIFNAKKHVLDVVKIGVNERDALDRYVADLGADVRPEGFDIDELDRFRAVLPDFADPILAEAHRLIISPHRVLHGIPFAAFYLDGVPLVRRFATRQVPNLGCLLASSTPHQTRQMAAVGVKDYNVPGQPLAPLKKAEAEAKAIAGLYAKAGWQAASLIGEVSEQQIKEQTGDAAILHFACHSKSVNDDLPLESELFLSRSRLDGLEIPLLGFSAKTVVLAACSGGQRAVAGRMLSELPGDDLNGLQAAFFAAGTDEVVAGLFPVKDYAALQIMPVLHQHIAEGVRTDVALARAIRLYLDNQFGPFAGREYWAPFFLTTIGQRPQIDSGEIS